MDIDEKYKRLKEHIKSLKSVAVAFSGGVDSTFLLKVSHDILGDNAIAITVRSCLFPEREFYEADAFCKKEGIKQIVLECDPLTIEGFRDNPANRCYLCKQKLFERILEVAEEHNMQYVLEGSNMDDTRDYRPGMKAVKELDIKSPLQDVNLYKQEIRELLKKLDLQTWDKPSFACLASRFVYGETITKEKLKMVEQAEQMLLDLGFHQVRIRIHGTMARIEVMPDEFENVLKYRNEITEKLKVYGFSYVSLDMDGYRTGSMNEMIEK